MNKGNFKIKLAVLLMIIALFFACTDKDEQKDKTSEVVKDQKDKTSEVVKEQKDKTSEVVKEQKDKTSEVVEEQKDKTDGNDYYPVTIRSWTYGNQPADMIFKKAPEKVVAFYQSPIETMLALGLGDRLVFACGLDEPVKDSFKEDFEKVNYAQKRPSKEEIMNMEPDLIIAWSSLFSDKVYGDIGFWNDMGANTYIWQNSGLKKPNTLENELIDIINIGKIFNVEKEAKKIVEIMMMEIQHAQEQVKDKEPVKALIIEVEKEGQYRVYGEGTIGGEIAMRVGADLVGKDKKKIGKEELISLNPDVIFSVYFGDSISRDQALTSLKDDTAIQTVSALKNNRVIPMSLSEVYASGIRTYDGIRTIIHGIYPDMK